MNDTIVKLNSEKEELLERVKTINDAITALQKLCDHKDKEYYCHDSHYDYEKCTECGKKFKE